jgi:hypothetical protein
MMMMMVVVVVMLLLQMTPLMMMIMTIPDLLGHLVEVGARGVDGLEVLEVQVPLLDQRHLDQTQKVVRVRRADAARRGPDIRRRRCQNAGRAQSSLKIVMKCYLSLCYPWGPEYYTQRVSFSYSLPARLDGVGGGVGRHEADLLVAQDRAEVLYYIL